MTRAELEPVEPDDARAGDFLEQAKRFLADAEASSHLESAVVLYWNACIGAMDAVSDARDIVAAAEDHLERHSRSRGS